MGGKEKGEMGVRSEDEEWQEEWESSEERGASESVLARGRYISFAGVSGRAGGSGRTELCTKVEEDGEQMDSSSSSSNQICLSRERGSSSKRLDSLISNGTDMRGGGRHSTGGRGGG